MTKTSLVLIACVLAACTSRRAYPDDDDLYTREGPSSEGDSTNDELVASDPAPTLPLPTPGKGAPAPAPSSSSSSAPSPTTPPPPPIAPCSGDGESEPNDNNPAVIGPNTCGTIVAGDVDKLVFDVNEGNVFSLSLEGDASLSMEVDAPCINSKTVSGPSARVRLEPQRDCTIHVTLKSTSSTKTGWHLRRDK